MLPTILIYTFKITLILIRAYTFVWFAWIILGWLHAFGIIQMNPFHPILRLLQAMTSGVVNKIFGNFRRYLVIGMFDLSPLLFLLVLTYIFPRVLAWLFFDIILRHLG